MAQTVIQVENLSKQYRIGGRQETYGSLRESLTNTFLNSLNRIKNRHSLRQPETIWALKDVSFEVKQGEVVGIIGRNGAGKSTLLKILSRITKPTIGQVRLCGRVGSLLEVGTGFHPELTGRENVYLNGAILGMTRAEIDKKFDEIVDFAEIDKFIDTPVKHYSSGMGLRLGFAVAAHLEPEILVVDEVLAVGDAAFQKKCLGKMGDVASEGRTVLFVSHNMVAVQNLCDRALLIDFGRVMDDGRSEIVISNYLQNAAQNIETPLLDRKDRKGSGAIQFSSVTFHNERGEQLNSLQSGENVIIRIGFENKSKINIRKLHITFNIDNSKGQRITTLSTYAKNEIFESVDPNNKFIEIHIERLPLMAGRYEFTLFSRIHGINGEIADWIQNAGAFYVEIGDFYRTGKSIPMGQGDFMIDYSFHLVNSERNE